MINLILFLLAVVVAFSIDYYNRSKLKSKVQKLSAARQQFIDTRLQIDLLNAELEKRYQDISKLTDSSALDFILADHRSSTNKSTAPKPFMPASYKVKVSKYSHKVSDGRFGCYLAHKGKKKSSSNADFYPKLASCY